MRWGRLVGLVALALLAGVACEDDAASPEGAAGEAGAPPLAGSSASGTSAHGGAGGAGASGEAGEPPPGGSSAGGACDGDAELWASLTAAPAACETADDCCVVVNSCLAEARVVHADDFDAAQSAWPYCGVDCVDCIPPVVRVSCDNGRCVGKVDSESMADGVSHCGDTVAMAGSPGQSFTCNDN